MKKLISILLVLATMLSCFVFTVSAQEVSGVVSDEGRLPFEDVKDNHWFAEAVELCYANDVINGMSEYTFGWNGQLTRAQFVTMLCNLEGVDTSEYNVTKFTDVKSSHWYYGAVAWAYENGIVNGMTETTFLPNGVLTRAQLSVVMNNYMKDKYTVELNENALDSFSDKPKSQYWYYDAMVYAVSAGLISGMSNGTLVATGNVTRAQAAVIFKNFMEKYYFGSCEHNLSEVTCTEAAVCEVCGMVNGLPNGHTLTAYDCGTGGVCTTCGEDVLPSSKHIFAEATSTDPRTCTVCGLTEGKALGHTNTTTVCDRCGKEFFARPLDKVAYYIMKKGHMDYVNSIGHKYYYYGISYEEYGVTTYLTYYPEDSIYIEHYADFEGVSHYTTIRFLMRGDTACQYEYAFYYGEDCMFVGKGILDSKTYSRNTVEGFSSYEGEIDPVFTDNINAILPDMIDDADYILDLLYGGTIRDLGLKVF